VKRSQLIAAVCALACAGPLLTTRALAQTSDAPVPIRFVFRSGSCGSAAEFVAKVEQRSARVRLLAGERAGRSLIVEIRRPDASGAVHGTVTVVEADGATRARKLKAKSCAEAMAGLSLIATVTLDPEAMLSAPEEPPAAAPPPPVPVAPPAAAKPIPLVPARPAPARAQYRASFGLEAAVLVSMSPEPALGGGAAAALELHPGELVSPLLRLSVVHAQRRGSSAGAGEANFAFTLPSVEVCPVRLGPRAVGIRPCAYGSLGLLEVWGSGGVQSETYYRPAGSAGAGLLFSGRLSEALEIIVDGRSGVPFSRDDFAFDDVVFFRTRPLLFSAVLGVAGGFP
jgi:hypothetical protein